MKTQALIPLIVALSTLPAHLRADTGTIVANSVFIRETPDKASRTVGSLVKGDSVEFSPVPGNSAWVKVKVAGKEGVIIRKALALKTKNPAPAASEKTVTAVTEPAESASEQVKPLKVIEVTPERTDEELRLAKENERLSSQIATLLPLKDEVASMRREMARKSDEISRKDTEMARVKKLIPSLDLALKVDEQGEDVKLSEVGYAKMLTVDKEVIVRVGTQNMDAGEKIMGRSAKRKFYIGNFAYYELDKQAVKTANR